MLVLDGIIMLTEFDEFAYHEMIVHVPLMTHPPLKMFWLSEEGCGTVREVLKHPSVERVHLCEIDRRVVEVCKEHLRLLLQYWMTSEWFVFLRMAHIYSHAKESL